MDNNLHPLRKVEYVDSFAAADESDRANFWSLTPAQRWEIMETLRKRNYGDQATEGLSRVLEFVEQP